MPHDKHGAFVEMKDAYDAWEPFAIGLLRDTASHYNSFVTYKQLAEFVQDQTGITHKALITNWIGELLGRVIRHCVLNDLPQLSSLCVTAEGTVGNGYRAVLAADHQKNAGDRGPTETLEQLDDHAARTRLDCYRYFGADLPPDGGEPTLTPQAKASRDYKRAQAKREAPPKLCPVHHTQLPATGVCDYCP
ncbi:hypothetical protein EB75_19955 [Mycobacterium sp. ST-F2]|uniref:hypothetical protein n=1 Tax=Mycobacterium sp. ST-F2 TaxID=1490484 RepID=UPI0009655B67|nr:hypothetical protein [Mycobacterium sp. ST-F2]OKH85645.1 hypothetical protein EB75_19955 [Mycobacterium sp. ST-F2]